MKVKTRLSNAVSRLTGSNKQKAQEQNLMTEGTESAEKGGEATPSEAVEPKKVVEKTEKPVPEAKTESSAEKALENSEPSTEKDSKDAKEKKERSSTKPKSRQSRSGRGKPGDPTKSRRRNGRRKPKDVVDKDQDESDDDSETLQHEPKHQLDDPLGQAYDLDGSPIAAVEDESKLPWHSDVSSAKEFFNTEILYRYDILKDEEQRRLQGSYFVELGSEGTWRIDVAEDLQINKTDTIEEGETMIHYTLSGADFLRLVNGGLNPQLAVLAEKLKVSGDIDRAMAFQSILTPSPE